MTNDTEPRALGAALAAPAFVTRGHGVAMHAANRHVERWAPETTAKRVRSMHTLGFVDRLVAPWVETAQRSASLRLFSQYAKNGASEREASQVSWVFPRPWYQDELDWMAAARQVRAPSWSSSGESPPAQAMPTLLTTRGTFVAPAQEAPVAAPPVAMPSALYEFVAPSLSLAAGRPAAIPGVGFGGETIARHDAYSPLIPLAAVQAADLMSRTVAPLAVQRAGAAPTAITPQLRSVLTSILERAASARMPAGELPTTRLAMSAPELVTPPAPRPADIGRGAPAAQGADALEATPRETIAGSESAAQVAERYAEQRARIVELQRLAQQSAQREAAARAEVASRAQAEAAARTTSESAAAGRAPGAGDAAASAAAAQARAAAQTAAMADARAIAQTAASAEARAATQAAATAEAQVAQAEVRAAAERAEAELRQRAAGPRATEAQRQAEAQGQADIQRQAEAAREAEAERARIEARIAQRVSERTGAQRLHEQARAEAAAHARTPLDVRLPESRAAAPAPRAELPAEVTAAIAGLPPELAALLGPTATARPEQTMQVIGQLNETLRTVELLARSSAAGVPFEAIRGPRLVMPAGLGGLISAVDRAQSIAARPAALAGERMLAPLPQLVAGQPQMLEQRAAAARAAREVRVPAMSWLSAAPAPSAAEPATALAATANAAPAGLSHVAWADRWLARFSGAAPQSLQAITAAGTDAPAMRMAALASAAPGSVFVVPDFARGDQGAHEAARFEAMARAAALADAPVGTAAAATAAAAAQSMVPAPRLINPLPSESLRRFDDTAETPDDVFAAISAAAARSRGTAAQAPAPRVVVSATPGTEPVSARQTYADLVAQSAPAAPGPGLSAQLASSPFAPGLRHVVPLPSAASFDVRSLFGAGLGATYLAGFIAQTSQPLEIGVQRSPAWASWAEAPLAQLGVDQIDRLVPAFEPAYVSPTVPSLDDQVAFGDTGMPAAETAAWPSVAAAQAAAAQAAAAQAAVAQASSAIPAAATQAAAPTADQTVASVPMTTLRSALLSWEVAADEQGAPQLVPGSFASLPYAGVAGAPATLAASAPTGQAASMQAYREMLSQLGGAARTMLEAMSLPMLGEGALDQPAAWAAPGMLANRAQSWSVAQERSTSDLALDFVAPELVAAARVYGLGPAEAAQAARLAVVGQSQLGAMASTVDRTFVEAMTIGREARALEAERQQRLAAGFSIASHGSAGARSTPGESAELIASHGSAGARSTPGGSAELIAAAAGFAPGVGAPAAMSPEVAAQLAQAAARAVPEGARAGIPDAQAPAAITTAFPASDGTIAAAIAPAQRAPLPAPSGVSFGVGRGTPRGAFLWPAATVAALGMNAGGEDGQSLMSVAALELLAAQVVAELGTFTALAEADVAARGGAGRSAAGAWAAPGIDAIGGELDASATGGSVEDSPSSRLAARAAALTAAAPYASAPGAAAGQPWPGAPGTAWPAAGSPAAGGDASAEPGEVDVLGAAAAMVPAARRGRFEALYVALSNSSAGRSWSPAARAARALALAGRSDEAITARERAATAWDVLPVVYAGIAGAGTVGAGASGAGALGDAGALEAGVSAAAAAAAMSEAMASSYVAPSGPGGASRPGGATGSFGGPRGVSGGGGGVSGGGGVAARAQRTGSRDFVAPDGGVDVSVSASGMSGLSARAGDALGSYVTPVAAPSMPTERSGDGAMLRAPSAAPEYVRTGGRFGGGEVEIPPWFEAAARKMLAERSGDGISMAELTLVTAAPPSHVAAATIQPSPAPTAPSSTSNPGQQAGAGGAQQIDVEKLAYDVYQDILHQMEIARSRNGDSFL